MSALQHVDVRHSKLPVNADTTEYTYEAIGP
jgi:hypothetical protein